ncbi:DUF4352 domain-containing protein [Mesobacillus subterraneus]|jgi:hypothetical protein|uniref:DUF4352 domain-containing protein n=1 Tax=Mesobacillus subterraneus TaxID=285983 RepID=UPI00203B88F3|nr:DUF4352 domain-containing protein [Mesobacillus subterraneus]MCM3664258.1 DUF4352 domain-containing protein [Mesobacillus subterraneus]MCM3682285.1 DUF4352 domain-containing protein [Mesobacillus subterraneus]
MNKYIAFVAAVLLLSGCSATGNDHKKEIKASDANNAVTKHVTSNVYVPNPQVTDDRKLMKSGDTFADRKGQLTLKAVQNVNKRLTIGGIQYTIKDVRLLHYVPDYSLVDFYHSYTHDEEFDFVKVNIEMENTSDEYYHFAPVAMMNINGTVHKTWEDDFYLEELNGEIAPGQLKRGNIGFIVEELDELNQIEILSGDLVGNDKKKEAAPVKLSIKVE